MVPGPMQRTVWGAFKYWQRISTSRATDLAKQDAFIALRQAQLRAYFMVAVREGLLERREPGVYLSTPPKQELILEIGEMLEAHGYQDNEANREVMIRRAQQEFGNLGLSPELAPHPEAVR